MISSKEQLKAQLYLDFACTSCIRNFEDGKLVRRSDNCPDCKRIGYYAKFLYGEYDGWLEFIEWDAGSWSVCRAYLDDLFNDGLRRVPVDWSGRGE